MSDLPLSTSPDKGAEAQEKSLKNIHKPRKTDKIDKIPVHEKTLYGFGGPALHMTTSIVDYQIQQVLVYGMGMSPAMKSVIVIIFRLWDALIDSLMGWISDNTRTRYGRPLHWHGWINRVGPGPA